MKAPTSTDISKAALERAEAIVARRRAAGQDRGHREPSVRAFAAALDLGFAVVRMEPGVEPVFLSSGTWIGLGQGIVATAMSRLLPKERGSFFLPHVHAVRALDGARARLRWAIDAHHNGLMLLALEREDAEAFDIADPDIASLTDLDADRTSPLAMPTFTRGMHGRATLEGPAEVRAGYHLADPRYETSWELDGRKAREPWLLCRASLDYPSDDDAGAPVVDDRGRLAGILAGPNDYHDLRNQGLYTPAFSLFQFAAVAVRDFTGGKREGERFHGIHEWAHYVD